MKAKYQIFLSKAEIGVDRSMKVLSIRAGTTLLSSDTICITVHAMQYNTYHSKGRNLQNSNKGLICYCAFQGRVRGGTYKTLIKALSVTVLFRVG